MVQRNVKQLNPLIIYRFDFVPKSSFWQSMRFTFISLYNAIIPQIINFSPTVRLLIFFSPPHYQMETKMQPFGAVKVNTLMPACVLPNYIFFPLLCLNLYNFEEKTSVFLWLYLGISWGFRKFGCFASWYSTSQVRLRTTASMVNQQFKVKGKS